MEKHFTARISLGQGSEQVRLTIEDDVSGVLITEIRFDYQTFGEFVAGRGHLAAVGSAWDNFHLIGAKREFKNELVLAPKHVYDQEDPRIRAAVAEFEVDGWMGNDRDLVNHHHSKGDGLFEVGYFRFVDADGNPVARDRNSD